MPIISDFVACLLDIFFHTREMRNALGWFVLVEKVPSLNFSVNHNDKTHIGFRPDLSLKHAVW
jgi:hypothetical protein